MFWVITKGGPVIIPIIIGSVIGFAIIIDKLWLFFKIRIDVQGFVDGAFAELERGRFDAALESCARNSHHPIGATFKAGIEKRNLAPHDHDIEKILERVGNSQMKNLERHIGGLISSMRLVEILSEIIPPKHTLHNPWRDPAMNSV